MEEFSIFYHPTLKIMAHDSTVIYFHLIILDNSALNGGVIKASSSIIDLTDSIFEYNMAYYAGVI